MNKDIMSKALVLSIIFLFIGVGIQPVFAVETKTSIVNKESVEDCGCQVEKDFNLDRVEEFGQSYPIFLCLSLKATINSISSICNYLRDKGFELIDLGQTEKGERLLSIANSLWAIGEILYISYLLLGCPPIENIFAFRI